PPQTVVRYLGDPPPFIGTQVTAAPQGGGSGPNDPGGGSILFDSDWSGTYVPLFGVDPAGDCVGPTAGCAWQVNAGAPALNPPFTNIADAGRPNGRALSWVYPTGLHGGAGAGL